MRRLKSIFWLFLAWVAVFLSTSTAQVPPPLPGAINMALSQISLSQTVSVSVQPINALSITGDVNLVISTSTPGIGLNPATDGLSATYSITSNDQGKKITGSLDAPFSAGLRLLVLLGQPTGGTSIQQELSTTSIDLVTGIGYVAEAGLSISYTANADINSAPNGTGETRTVTLTMVDN